MCDMIFGRESFINEIIWAYDFGARSNRKWPTKHDNILVYAKNPSQYYFNTEEIDREPYMPPGLVTKEKAARSKLPTDVWWHTIVSPTGKEKTGYPAQKPLGLLRRMIAASTREGDWVLDFFAGSGTTGAAAAELGRKFVMVDQNPPALKIMKKRLNCVSARTYATALNKAEATGQELAVPDALYVRHRSAKEFETKLKAEKAAHAEKLARKLAKQKVREEA